MKEVQRMNEQLKTALDRDVRTEELGSTAWG